MIDNIIICIGIIIVLCIVALGVCHFLKLGKEKQIQIITEWLLLAVVQAEKELGGGTGQIKLRYVYDLFLSKFKFISTFISFEQFSSLVDIALDKMNNILQNNKNLQEYIEK